MPRLIVGMKSPCTEECVEDSGQTTPSIRPVPNFSGCLEIFFSVAYATKEAIVGPVPGISEHRLPTMVPRHIGKKARFMSALVGRMSLMPTLVYLVLIGAT